MKRFSREWWLEFSRIVVQETAFVFGLSVITATCYALIDTLMNDPCTTSIIFGGSRFFE